MTCKDEEAKAEVSESKYTPRAHVGGQHFEQAASEKQSTKGISAAYKYVKRAHGHFPGSATSFQPSFPLFLVSAPPAGQCEAR
jgi:hypothetical protein